VNRKLHEDLMKLATLICLIATGAFVAPAVLVSSAHADDTPTCWRFGKTPGPFSWTQSPSTACRDGALVSGTVAGEPAVHPARNHDVPYTGGPAPTATFTFSGNAYVGVAAQF
jgi:hypothetical protein